MAARLLYIVRPAAGGMAGHIRMICAGLDSSAYQITLACPPDTPGLPAGIQSLPLPVADRIAPMQDWHVLRSLRRLMNRRKYDLTHAHGLKAALLTACVCRSKQAPPLVITLHNSLPPCRPGIGGRLVDALLRWLFRTARMVVVVSQAQAHEIQARHLVKPQRLTVIHNGIPASPAEAGAGAVEALRAKLGIAADAFVALMVGRMIAAKGVGDLLAAALMLSDTVKWQILIAGTGPDLPRFANQAASSGLDTRVRFLGHRADVPYLLQAANVFVLPSHSEGLPLSILEAMSAKRAVIATNVGGIPELVEHGTTGLLVPPSRPSALAEAIMRLAHQPDLCATYGQNGFKRLQEHFTAEQMLRKLASVYESMLNADS